MGDTPGLGFWERGGDGRGATMEGEGGGAVIRFGKERERRVGIPHKNLGDPPPQLGITTVLDLGWKGRWIWASGEGSGASLGGRKRGEGEWGPSPINLGYCHVRCGGGGGCGRRGRRVGTPQKNLGVLPSIGLGVGGEFWGRFLGLCCSFVPPSQN